MENDPKRAPSRPEDRGWKREDADSAVRRLVATHRACVIPDFMNVCAFEYNLTFRIEMGLIVTVNILLHEWQTDSNIVITNITTLPILERRKGYGSHVLAWLLEWAKKKNIMKFEPHKSQMKTRGVFGRKMVLENVPNQIYWRFYLEITRNNTSSLGLRCFLLPL